MKIWEINLGEIGAKYKDEHNTWVITCCSDLMNVETGECIENIYPLQLLLRIEFEKVEKVDWSKVSVDTKILVKNSDLEYWVKRYFAKYENGRVYAWGNGKTSFTVRNNSKCISWDCAKLYEGSEE